MGNNNNNPVTGRKKNGLQIKREIEDVISYFLRYGMYFCACIMATGIFLSLVYSPSNRSSFSASQNLFAGKIVDNFEVPRSPMDFLRTLHDLNPDGIISLGVLCLIFLPIFRVALTALLFIWEKDVIFSIITGIVFIGLVTGLVLGYHL